jgi:hypothetical protein
MRSDPRRAMWVALVIAMAVGLWFVALAVAGDALWAHFGMTMHAITFLGLFAEIVALVAAAVFSRWATVRRDLLAGRDVVGRWTIDPATFAAVMPGVVAADRRDKWQALLTIWGFLAVIFGAFALYDPSVAVPMLATAAVVAAVTGAAYLLSARRSALQAVPHDGRVVIGRRGLLVDGELHVWAIPIGGLETVALSAGERRLDVVYGWVSRVGWQSVGVSIPVPPSAVHEARRAVTALGGGPSRPRRRRKPAAAP